MKLINNKLLKMYNLILLLQIKKYINKIRNKDRNKYIKKYNNYLKNKSKKKRNLNIYSPLPIPSNKTSAPRGPLLK